MTRGLWADSCKCKGVFIGSLIIYGLNTRDSIFIVTVEKKRKKLKKNICYLETLLLNRSEFQTLMSCICGVLFTPYAAPGLFWKQGYSW